MICTRVKIKVWNERSCYLLVGFERSLTDLASGGLNNKITIYKPVSRDNPLSA